MAAASNVSSWLCRLCSDESASELIAFWNVDPVPHMEQMRERLEAAEGPVLKLKDSLTVAKDVLGSMEDASNAADDEGEQCRVAPLAGSSCCNTSTPTLDVFLIWVAGRTLVISYMPLFCPFLQPHPLCPQEVLLM